MGRDSSHSVEIVEGLGALGPALSERSARRVLLITGEGRRFAERVSIDGVEIEVFDGARVHVPRHVVADAAAALARSGADTVVTLGGGSATGLGKALRLEHDVRFIAVPTTYSGSEMTNIWGIREGDTKTTGRDDRIRPDLVIHEPSLFGEMPKKLTATSLINALAHPISALSTGDDSSPRDEALAAIEALSRALDDLLEDPRSACGRRTALRGAALAGTVIDRATLGAHHAVAHLLGGRLGLDHAGLHSVLLPHFVRRLFERQRELYEAIADAAGHADLPAVIYDGLTRAGAARSVVDLGADRDALAALRDVEEELAEPWVLDAVLGRRPSIRTRRVPSADRPHTSVWGPELADADRVIVALHGRGANADRWLKDVQDLIGYAPATTIVAPQAPDCSWYSKPYTATTQEHGGELDAALSFVADLIGSVLEHVAPERVFLVGFSQGACLASEAFARCPVRLGGLVALAGARTCPADEQPPVVADLSGARAVLGVAESDPFLSLDDVRRTAEGFAEAGADVTLVTTTGDAHEVSARQRVAAREAVLGRSLREGQRGFGNAHESEALPGALPLHQNSPREAPYGLYAEQINGTGFVAERRNNRRVWTYRVRPSAQLTEFEPLSHPTFLADWDDQPPEPSLCGWAPMAVPTAPTDFVDGIATFGGAGHPSLRRGYAIHLYAANRSMEHRAFYDADGELLIVPQDGALTLQTELGVLDVAPGQIAIVPRGLKVSVHLHGATARGYVGEIYGRHFELPERGPVGSNGLTDARHFRAPTAYFENRVDPGYRVTAKLGNALFDATQDFNPYDVVAWHGDYAPYVYDLRDFSPVGNTRFDHPDPSIYTVLASPMDETGADTLDFVFFPPRWDATEHTFRPPYFHRNATTEFNGIIADPSLRPDGSFQPGCYFLTPSMTPHGVMAGATDRVFLLSAEEADAPERIPDTSMWIQFETTLPIGLTSWAKHSENRVGRWPSVWGSYRSRFDP